MGAFRPPRWFSRELELVHPDLFAIYNDRTQRWEIWQGFDIWGVVQTDPPDKLRLPLDRRILTKVRFDAFLTRNPKFRDAYYDAEEEDLENNPNPFQEFLPRGITGIEEYLQDYRKGV